LQHLAQRQSIHTIFCIAT